MERYVNIRSLSPSGHLPDWANNLGDTIARRSLGVLGGIVGGAIKVLFIIFTMYYLFRDSKRIRDALCDVIPLERAQSKQIFNRAREVVQASVYGVLVIAAIQGALGGAAFALLGLPSPIAWGVVMFLLSIVPFAGSYLVWIPATLFLAINGNWGKALILTVWGALIIGTIDNFLRPKLVGEKTKLHELLIFFSMIGGLQIFGILGLVLGPVIVAVTLAFIDIFKQMDRSSNFFLPDPVIIEPQPEIQNLHTNV